MIPIQIQKALALTLLTTVLYGVWLFVAGPWAEGLGWSWAQFEKSHERSVRYQQMLELKDNNRSGQLDARLRDFEERLFRAETPALALSEMRGLVNTITRSIDVAMTSSTSISFEDAGSLTKIGFRARLTLENDELIDLLAQIEGADQRIFVESMEVSLASNRNGGAPKLDVQLELGGFAKVGAAVS